MLKVHIQPKTFASLRKISISTSNKGLKAMQKCKHKMYFITNYL